jgi:hypothetical protein
MAITATRMRRGLRTFGRIITSPLADVERTVELTARLQQQLIRTDALPEPVWERRVPR